MEDHLFGAPDGPGRRPPLRPLDFEEDTGLVETTEVSTPVSEEVSDVLLTPESGNFQLTSSILDRTPPFLE